MFETQALTSSLLTKKHEAQQEAGNVWRIFVEKMEQKVQSPKIYSQRKSGELQSLSDDVSCARGSDQMLWSFIDKTHTKNKAPHPNTAQVIKQ